MFLDTEKVKQFLPHREPFLFIDSIEHIEFPAIREIEGRVLELKELAGTKVKAHFKIQEDMEVLRGHFPGNPIVPGVCQIEMMAQAAAFTVVGCVEDVATSSIQVALLGTESSRFRKPVTPGMDLVIYAECVKSRGSFSHYECRIEHDNKIVSEAKVFASCKI